MTVATEQKQGFAKTKIFAPGLRGFEFFRFMPNFRRDLLGSFDVVRRRFGDIVCFRGLWTAYVLFAPAEIEYVLQTNSRNYGKGINYQILKHSTGNGLFTSENDFWLRQRRLAQPIFHRHKIADFAAQIVESATAALDKYWEPLARRGEPFDLMPELMRLTLGVIGKTMVSTDLSEEAGTFAKSYEVVREYTMRRIMGAVRIPLGAPLPLNFRFRRAIRRVDRIIYDLIAERRPAPEKFNDLLTMLMLARDEESGETMSDVQLRDELMTMIGAGYETTTQALGWTFYLLTQHRAAEARVRAEIETVLNGGTPTFDDLPRLEYTQAVFKEAMRVFAPVWGFARQALNDDEIGGYFVPAKSQVLIFPFLTHRHPDIWNQPDEFLPDRFLSENAAGVHKFAYFPFGGGARKCIGNNFAQMEAQLIIALIFQRFRVRLCENQIIEPEASVTLRPKNGVRVILEKL